MNGRDLALKVVTLERLADALPVEMGPEAFNVGSFVALEERREVRMLPEVDANHWGALDESNSSHECVVLVVGLGDHELTLLCQAEPHPSRKNSRHYSFRESFLKAYWARKVLVDVFSKLYPNSERSYLSLRLIDLDCSGRVKDAPEK